MTTTPPTDTTRYRANNENSVCVYCKTKIGMAMKCPGCGWIDPPVTTPDTTVEKWVGELIQLVSDGMIERLGLEPDGHKTWATTTDEIVKELSEELTEQLPQALQQQREKMITKLHNIRSKHIGYISLLELSDLLTKEEAHVQA